MLPQEKFVHNCLYDGNFLGKFSMFNAAAVDGILQSCFLKYRKGKGIKDLQNAFWGYGSLWNRSYDKHMNQVLSQIDGILTIDWKLYIKAS